MRRGTRFGSLVIGSLALAACGGESPPAKTAPHGPWSSAKLVGVEQVVAATVYEGQLIVAAAGERRLFVVDRAHLAHATPARARPLPMEVAREAVLEGYGVGPRADELGTQGYALGLLWDQPIEVVGLAARRLPSRGRAPDFESLYLLERTYGVVWWGRLTRAAEGHLEALRLEAAFAVPDRPRQERERLDWRDTGPGLAGLALSTSEADGDDLLAVERVGLEKGVPRLERLDRFGQSQRRWRVDLRPLGSPEVRALSSQGTRQVLLLGGGRGVLVTPGAPGTSSMAAAGEAVPTPEVEGVSAWRALAHAPDGTTYLVSEGPAPVLAWRAP